MRTLGESGLLGSEGKGYLRTLYTATRQRGLTRLAETQARARDVSGVLARESTAALPRPTVGAVQNPTAGPRPRVGLGTIADAPRSPRPTDVEKRREELIRARETPVLRRSDLVAAEKWQTNRATVLGAGDKQTWARILRVLSATNEVQQIGSMPVLPDIAAPVLLLTPHYPPAPQLPPRPAQLLLFQLAPEDLAREQTAPKPAPETRAQRLMATLDAASDQKRALFATRMWGPPL